MTTSLDSDHAFDRAAPGQAEDCETPQRDAVFSNDWLSSRERVDHESRDPALTARLAAWLRARHPVGDAFELIDLGCGSGSNLRYLAPRLPGPQHWLLIDHDSDLLAQTHKHCVGLTDGNRHAIALTTQQANLAEPESLKPGRSDLVTASALLDLVSADWLCHLAEHCAGLDAAALLTLSIDGRIELHDAHGRQQDQAFDQRLIAALSEHQQRDKGFGRALGPQASSVARTAFEQQNYQVSTARSDWQLDSARDADHALMRQLFDGWQQALREQCPGQSASIGQWHERKQQAIESGDLSVRIGHVDLLALPGEEHA